MVRVLSALGAGLLFGVGLIVAGMSNPAKVQGFLDLAGAWDPSLALVMVGAIALATPAFLLAGRRGEAVLGGPLAQPATRAITPRLLLGSLLFGIGWGLVGLCPGPALVQAGTLAPKAALFVAAMLAGMLLFSRLERRRA
jgi:uncharacterized membrane protein YedE/YeeE